LEKSYKNEKDKTEEDLIAEAEKNRAQGKLTNADLDNFASTIRPMLNSSQAKRLDKILEKLKKS